MLKNTCKYVSKAYLQVFSLWIYNYSLNCPFANSDLYIPHPSILLTSP